ncbi:Flp pilus assembly complex ATPase component TadA [Candidatus Desantisbacteria bacterium]|nr:Flp pilus assembly complex ATPase component TadA [Candidatus Desantisbacteria bacterium]
MAIPNKDIIQRYRLGEMLVRDKMITEKQLQIALTAQRTSGKRLGRMMRELGFISEEVLMNYLSQQLRIPQVSLADIDEIPSELIKAVPGFLVRRHLLIPISKTAQTITVAMTDPLDIFAIDDATLLLGHYQVIPVIAPEAEILAAIEKYYGDNMYREAVLQGAKDKGIEVIRDEPRVDISKISREAEEAPIIRLVNRILLEAITVRASDIHIEPMEKELRIRYRIDGVLHRVMSSPKDIHLPVIARIKVISHMDITEHRIPQNGRCKVILEESSVDLRVSSIPTVFGEKVVIRILDSHQLNLDLSKLGFEPETLRIYQNLIKSPYGIILITGPTGCGKTTTLYSTLSTINTEDKNIMTIEDPVEYILSGIIQQQVQPEVGLDFSTGLKGFLRQDPDIIMIGEIRDKETAEIAINAALTGHMVFATLHTNDAAGVVIRLLNMGIPPYLIVSTVVLSLAQRLMRLLCPKCKQPYESPPEPLIEIGKKKKKNVTLYSDSL